MANVASSANGSYDTVNNRYDFMNFDLEEPLSVKETVTGVVRRILRIMYTLG
jgi:hypothetical protein